MVRRTTLQSKTDEIAFPIRVKFEVPANGLGAVAPAIDLWLRDNVGTGRYAVHPARSLAAQALGIYFIVLDDARRFIEAFPMLAIADATRLASYYSPYRRVD